MTRTMTETKTGPVVKTRTKPKDQPFEVVL